MVTVYDKDYFEKNGYKGYRDFDAHKLRVQKIIDMVHPSSVLDVGCAYGYIVRRLLDLGIYAVGMDISEWAEQIAANLIPHNFIRHDMRITPYPFRDKEFDLLYCEGVLEHIEANKIIPIMKEFERISHERILQITYIHFENADKEEGHINLQDNGWWLVNIPPRTWINYEAQATEGCQFWLYKG